MNIEFTWIGGATWILDVQGLKIACDPVLCPAGTIQDYGFFSSKRLEDPVFADDDFENVDVWLITHGHEDHLDKSGLAQIRDGAQIVTHKNALKFLQEDRKQNITVLRWGEEKSYKIKGLHITVEAVPAVHGVNPLVALFAGGVNGYWVTIRNDEEPFSMYITSDTVSHRKVRRALQGRRVNLLIPNMGAVKKGSWMGTLTFSAQMLRGIISIVRPKLCIPVHFGTFEHYVEPISEVEKWQDKNIMILEPGQTYTRTL